MNLIPRVVVNWTNGQFGTQYYISVLYIFYNLIFINFANVAHRIHKLYEMPILIFVLHIYSLSFTVSFCKSLRCQWRWCTRIAFFRRNRTPVGPRLCCRSRGIYTLGGDSRRCRKWGRFWGWVWAAALRPRVARAFPFWLVQRRKRRSRRRRTSQRGSRLSQTKISSFCKIVSSISSLVYEKGWSWRIYLF